MRPTIGAVNLNSRNTPSLAQGFDYGKELSTVLRNPKLWIMTITDILATSRWQHTLYGHLKGTAIDQAVGSRLWNAFSCGAIAKLISRLQQSTSAFVQTARFPCFAPVSNVERR
jgi:hypothetical protein